MSENGEEFDFSKVDYSAVDTGVGTDGYKDSDEVTPDPEVNDELVKRLSLFREKAQPKTDVVYYPNGSDDISPKVAFPDSRIIFVEDDPDYIDTLVLSGVELHEESPESYIPDTRVDILVMNNTTLDPDKFTDYLHDTGYIVCNNYFDTADALKNNPSFELQAVVRTVGEKYEYDIEALGDYFKEVETDDEFKSAARDSKTVSFGIAQDTVESGEDVLAKYKKLIAGQGAGDNYESQIGNMPTEEIDFSLKAKLPKKKGTSDDLFVFKKKASSPKE